MDVGCGDAGFWGRNIDRLPKGVKITLLDKYYSTDQILANRLNATFMRGDICDMSYEKIFDVVIAKDVLYLVENIDKCVYTMAKAIKNDGVVYGTYYSVNHMEEIYKIINEIGLCSDHQNQYHTFNSKNAESRLSKFFSSIKVLPKEDALNISNINDAVLFIMSYLKEGDQTELVKRKIFNYITSIFEQEGKLIANRKMYLFAAKDCLL